MICVEGASNRRNCGRANSLLLVALALVLLLHLGNEVLDVEDLDHLLKDWVLADLDILDLNLGLLGDKVHLTLSFLL